MPCRRVRGGRGCGLERVRVERVRVERLSDQLLSGGAPDDGELGHDADRSNSELIPFVISCDANGSVTQRCKHKRKRADSENICTSRCLAF